MPLNRAQHPHSFNRFGARHVTAAATILLSVSTHITTAAVITAKSVSFPDVAAAVGAATDGDTVTIPPGTESWTSTLVITKGITLQGGGDDKTVILDDVPTGGNRQLPGMGQGRGMGQRRGIGQGGVMGQGGGKGKLQGSGGHGPPGERKNAGVGGGQPILLINVAPHQTFRLTGLTLRYGARATKPQNQGCVKIEGTCWSVRVDHCHFDQLYNNALVFYGWIYGVVDHCRWDVRAHTGSLPSIIVNNGATWGGGTNNYGDGSWAAPTNFGSEKFLFIEDNVMNNLGAVQTAGGIDCQDGGRYVSRHNQFFNCTMITGHGTESGGRHRGQRAIEFYNNKETVTVPQGIGITRSGVTIYHSNIWSGPIRSGPKGPHIPLTVYRCDFPYHIYGGASGTSPWDVNDTEGNGTSTPGHKPHLYASGKHTGASASDTLVSSGAGWKPDQWVGYMLTNTTQLAKSGYPHLSRILSNTNDTITFARETPDAGPKTFNTGDGFAIYKLLIALDQPSRGQGDLLAGNPPVNTVTRGSAWPHQALEPIYAWDNKLNGSVIPVGTVYPTLRENRDYYNQNDSFNGTSGVGVGLLADRPKTCTAGVAFWATDQGEWDSTHSGPDGQLYVCTAPNTWTLYYKPFTYPHPLVSGEKRVARSPGSGEQ
jgi:hypothetical protein